MTRHVEIRTRKVRKEKEDADEVYRKMLELYTMVPPKPGKIKKTGRPRDMKTSKGR